MTRSKSQHYPQFKPGLKLIVQLRFTLVVVLLLVLSLPRVGAQVKIGLPAGAANTAAILDVSNTAGGNKGLLFPLVTLLNTTTWSLAGTATNGMVVFNTAPSGSGSTAVFISLYIWNNGQWNQMSFQSGTSVATYTGGTLTCTGTQSGTYQAGVAMVSSNTQVTSITLGTAGAYSATTTMVNGVIFSAYGTALSTGVSNFTLTASGTPVSGGTFVYPISFGGQSCSFNVTFTPAANFACGTAITVQSPTGVLVNSTNYTGSYTIAYTAGNGTAYDGTAIQTINGLTLARVAGTYAASGGNVVYTLSGIAGAAATATFTIPECTTATFGCTNDIRVGSGAIVQMMYDNTGGGMANYSWCARTVLGPDSLTWLDRNLGAYKVAASSTDAAAYGSLYQWGRNTDGHQRIINSGVDNGISATTATLANTNTPGNVGFITSSSGNYDWRSDNNNYRWNNITGNGATLMQENNPCPSGYHVPINAENVNVATGWANSANAYSSTLKLPAPGYRANSNGSLNLVGGDGNYWSATPNNTSAYSLSFGSGGINFSTSNYRVYGFSVRCLKN